MFNVKCDNVLTCSVGGGHSNFFDFDGDEILAHLSLLIFFGSKKKGGGSFSISKTHTLG